MAKIVNCWNEWDPLKRVIVGRPDGTMIQPPEPGKAHHMPYCDVPYGLYRELPEDLQVKAREQMDNFVSMLENRGIIVDRPTPIDFSRPVQTPDWYQGSSFGCMPTRDILLAMGNEILETTMSFRSRWFEFLCYRPILEEYFREDPEFVWEAAPKPRLTDESYYTDYWYKYHMVWTEEEKMERCLQLKWVQREKEPLFDAADVLRLGKDIFVQRSVVSNEAGISWLRRHFEPKGFRIHRILTDGSSCPWHIDANVLAIRPGLCMQCEPWPVKTPEFFELFKKNDWEIINAVPPVRTGPHHPWGIISPLLYVNTFMIDPKTICVEAEETAYMEQLDKLGLEVVPVPFWEVSPFGGGLHCSTVDVYREGDLKDYFPKQIPGF